jgi:ornithine decarboxylase
MVATVIGLAERAGRRWVHLDVGAFNGFMEALESGHLLRFPATDSRGSALRSPAHLTGPTCDSQDTIMFDVPLSVDLEVEDRVFLGTAGAYTTSYASGFNGFAVATTYAAGLVDA